LVEPVAGKGVLYAEDVQDAEQSVFDGDSPTDDYR